LCRCTRASFAAPHCQFRVLSAPKSRLG
jgi:hypothetical protein